MPHASLQVCGTGVDGTYINKGFSCEDGVIPCPNDGHAARPPSSPSSPAASPDAQPSTAGQPTPSPPPDPSSVPIGAIIGGVVGGIGKQQLRGFSGVPCAAQSAVAI